MAMCLVGQSNLEGERSLVEMRDREGSSKEMNLEAHYRLVGMMVRSLVSNCWEVQP